MSGVGVRIDDIFELDTGLANGAEQLIFTGTALGSSQVVGLFVYLPAPSTSFLDSLGLTHTAPPKD